MRHLPTSPLRVLAVATCLVYGTARAEALAGDELVAAQAPGGWYGWQLMLVDLASTAAIVGGGVASQDGGPAVAIPIAGGVGYLAGGPLVHLAHGERDRAWRSTLLRAFLPLGAGALAAGVGALAAGSGSSDVCSSKRACGAALGGVVGFGAGMLAAMVADWWDAGSSRTFVSPLQPSSRVAEAHAWLPLVVVGPRTTVTLAFRF
jgi:hypothetical protein